VAVDYWNGDTSWAKIADLNVPIFGKEDFVFNKNANYDPNASAHLNTWVESGDYGNWQITKNPNASQGSWDFTDTAKERLKAGGWDLNNSNNIAVNPMNTGFGGGIGSEDPNSDPLKLLRQIGYKNSKSTQLKFDYDVDPTTGKLIPKAGTGGNWITNTGESNRKAALAFGTVIGAGLAIPAIAGAAGGAAGGTTAGLTASSPEVLAGVYGAAGQPVGGAVAGGAGGAGGSTLGSIFGNSGGGMSSGAQSIGNWINGINTVAGWFGNNGQESNTTQASSGSGSGSSTTVGDSQTVGSQNSVTKGTNTEQLQIDTAGVMKYINDLMKDPNLGLGQILGQEQSVGLYGGTQAAFNTNDLLDKIAGTVAQLTAKKVTTTDQNTLTTNVSNTTQRANTIENKNFQTSGNQFNDSQKPGFIGSIFKNARRKIFRSDMRLKDNIKHLGYTEGGYPWYEYDINGVREQGVMAQDLLVLLPEAVIQDEDGFYSVDYSKVH
jgi:hypothetical protein